MSKEEIERWQQAILADTIEAQRALDQLERTDHARFVALCRDLADDASETVRQIALRKLGQRGDRDDPRAEASALEALQHPTLQYTALFALGTVGTSRAFPVLLTYARAGSDMALASASNQVRTQAEAGELLTLARQYIMVPGIQGFKLREKSVLVLIRHSTVAAEQEVLLASARLYADDFVIEALADANVEVLDDLRELRATYPPDCVEYKALTYAIDTLERRKATARRDSDDR
jgi:hypothetical protein